MRTLVLALAAFTSVPALAIDLRTLFDFESSDLATLFVQIEDARARAEYDLAASLLDEAERASVRPNAELLIQRGFLARERGKPDDALGYFAKAADLDSASPARVEQASTLVTLGRWPEAVEILGRAFEERGSALRVDDIVKDPRFAALVDLPPYKDLVAKVRADQSGPLGRIFYKFEQLETSVRTAERVLAEVASAMSMASRLWASQGTRVVILLTFGLLFGFGLAQLGLRAPWPLFIGVATASVLWHLGAKIATLGDRAGFATIAPAVGITLGGYFVARGISTLATRLLGRRRRWSTAEIERRVRHAEDVAAAGRRLLAAEPAAHETMAREFESKVSGMP